MTISTRFLVLLGILTLIATRLFGDIGLVVLSVAGLRCTSLNMSVFASFFWISRLLLQGFVAAYVANVTGINLMHAYCSAALYFGFFAILFVLLILHINSKKWLPLAVMLFIGLLAPPIFIYLMHEEPTASFLVAANVAAILLISFSAMIFKGKNASQANLMLMPLMMLTTALLSGPLVAIGNTATVSARLQLVSYVAAVPILVYLVFFLIDFSKRRQKSN